MHIHMQIHNNDNYIVIHNMHITLKCDLMSKGSFVSTLAEEAISALSNMCHVPEKSAVQPGKAIPQIQPTRTLYESNEQRIRTTRRTMYLLRGLPGSGKTYLAKYFQ